jgi:hypothetical protein
MTHIEKSKQCAVISRPVGAATTADCQPQFYIRQGIINTMRVISAFQQLWLHAH